MSPVILSLTLTILAAGGDDGAKIDRDFKPNPAWKQLGESLWFDRAGKRIVLRARVSIRDGGLEHLLCRKGTKEHEAILATPAQPKLIHAGLLALGAEPGRTVRYKPEFSPPSGTPIAIELEWLENGTEKHANARDWVRDEKTGKTLSIDWVFAGSELVKNLQTGELFYAADDGDVITVSNFPSSMLDLPFASSASDTERMFIANADKIPPRDTWVTVSLKPVQNKKPDAKRNETKK